MKRLLRYSKGAVLPACGALLVLTGCGRAESEPAPPPAAPLPIETSGPSGGPSDVAGEWATRRTDRWLTPELDSFKRTLDSVDDKVELTGDEVD
ncbi:hypothetical protein [Massilia sp. YMA4]|uniref:hypothetical protein n=1 Tax=Massilia sp. YMA4 TaxID=1593482 RepID=UPI001581E419|nr:hypothetical protein [Massilia sp. YMA4]